MASTTRVTAPAMSSSRLSVWASSVSGMAIDQRRPVGETERGDAVLGAAAPRADREQGRIAKRAAVDRGRQVRRREHVAAVVEDHGLPDLVAGGVEDHAERPGGRIGSPSPGRGPGPGVSDELNANRT